MRPFFYRILYVLPFSSGEASLLEELWAYLEGKYFSVDLGRYDHLSVQSGSLINFRNIILGMCVGIVIAAAVSAYYKNHLGRFVRKVIREQCLWPDKAMTLAELGYEKNTTIRGNLKHGVLSKVVKCVEKEAYKKDVEAMRDAYIEKNGSDVGFVAPAYEMDLQSAHFYIPDEEHYAADIRFDQKGSGWRAFILVLIVAIIIAVLVCFLLPEMLQLVDNMIGILKGDGNVLN